MSPRPEISISVVSHKQAELIKELLRDLQVHSDTPIEVILTLNVPEMLPFDPSEFGFPVELIKNDRAKGFAANHNTAFRIAQTDYFCVLNPDVRFAKDPFPKLLEWMSNPKIGVAAPLIVNPAGNIEDSARKFPTPLSLLRKALSGRPTSDYPIEDAPSFPDWIAGMFMMFRSDTFRRVGGFDEGYFLYYEDVDLCWRLRRQGYGVALLPTVRVTHAAQRASHRDLRHLGWHVSSMLRFFIKRALESLCLVSTKGPHERY